MKAHIRGVVVYQIPYVVRDTGRGERAMDIYSLLLQDRIIFIGTAIDDGVANAVIAQLLFLRAEDPKKDISLYINSPGGDISSGLAIYDTMKFMSYDINTYCIGLAASISALLLAAGTKGKRFALPHSQLMIHQPYGAVGGTAADIAVQAQQAIKVKKTCAEILSESSGRPLSEIERDFDRDYFLTPKEALDYGLIDKIALQPQRTA